MNPTPVIVRPRDIVQARGRHLRRRRSQVRREVGDLRLWLPVTPLFWMLAPFALLLAPLVCLAPPLRGMNPYAAAWVVGDVLTSIGGTVVDVQTPGRRVRIRLL